MLVAFSGVCAIFFVLAFRNRRFAVVPFVALIGIAIYVFGFWRRDLAGTQYFGLGQLVLIATFFRATFLAGGWAFLIRVAERILRHKTSRTLSTGWILILAALPALYFIARSFERQIVYPSACVTDAAIVTVAGTGFLVHPELSTRLERAPVSQNAAYSLTVRYFTDPKSKEDLRRLCDMANGGENPVPMDMIWMTPATAHARMLSTCNDPTAANRPYCAIGVPDSFAGFQTIKIINRRSLKLPTHLGWLEHEDRADLISGGDAQNGFFCNGTDDSAETVNCNAWRQIAPDVSLLVKTLWESQSSKRRHLQRADELLDWVPRAFMY